MLTDTRKSPFAQVAPLSGRGVTLKHGFWHEVVETTARMTVPHLQSMFEDASISHVLENFRICAGESEGEHAGTVFGDGDFYKWMEAATYAAVNLKDQVLLDQLEAYCTLIAKAQLDDGYISTKQIIGEMTENGKGRMGDVNDFEIYNMGHLFTAACLYERLTGQSSLMQVAIKAADYLEKLYTDAHAKGEVKTAVCPSHYMGLIEMHRHTGEKRYLELAQLAIELRDTVEGGTDDNQDRLPLKEHTEIMGHAVRANYLYAGVADLYAETGDKDYLKVLNSVWQNLISQKIYITGGCGALYNGVSPYGNFFVDQKVHQSYSYAYHLPNITAYNETCASVGLVMWAYRMFQIDPQRMYMDWLERTMLNVNLASVSFDGNKYFYENMLRRTKSLPYELVWPLERTGYIYSYCCPPNIARTLTQVSEYFYLTKNNELWCGLYGENEADVVLEDVAFKLHQETSYPYEGRILFYIKEANGSKDRSWTLKVRVPSWAKGGSIKVGDTVIDLTTADETGYIALALKVVEGLCAEVQFDMPTRLTRAHGMVEETTNQVAVERGPLVYCVEHTDASLESLDGLLLDPKSAFELSPLKIKDREVMALEGSGYASRQKPSKESLYESVTDVELDKVDYRLIPYFAWDNRGFGEMKIWLPLTYK